MQSIPQITLTLNEARIIQDILRHVSTSNHAVVEASFTMYNALQQRIDTPPTCICSNGAPVR
jgi:hypothetical protein